MFAITVTSSVKLAGVLIVFALLLSPAMIALSLHVKHPLIIAWIAGTIINIIAICLSYTLDLPTGYTLVALHTITAMCVSFVSVKA
ncbi:MAG TPA: metal ABC transporter permease [Spirochaetota bacterium]|nr:metal ABC transporter permease [Spirochaetota bacterium]HOM10829.1 metal ABC transporter permease [Spirochaetota bacterium]HPP50522.1 metal ABC transporter permease [Spirochaetota bacterium]